MSNFYIRAWAKLRRDTLRGRKYFYQLIQNRGENPAPLFEVGAQRSGTNMILRVLDRSLDTWVYPEDHKLAFDNCRIKPYSARMKLVRRARCKWVVFKPLCDTQNIDRLLNEHPESKALWILRNYGDVANSAIQAWGNVQLELIKGIANNSQCDHWIAERLDEEIRDLIDSLYSANMSLHTAAALKWYLRNTFFFKYSLDTCPNRVLLIRYEDLVYDPGRYFQKIFRFLRIDYRPAYAADINSESVGKCDFPKIDPRVESLCDSLSTRMQDQTWCLSE